MRFNGWSDYAVPDPILNRIEAIKRALEFARTDEFMLDRCVIDVPDRSEEDKPRYVCLKQVASTPFWKVDGISCSSGHGVLIYVDALDGRTVWFKGDGESASGKKYRQSLLDDQGVWFLEGDDIVFAKDWPMVHRRDSLAFGGPDKEIGIMTN